MSRRMKNKILQAFASERSGRNEGVGNEILWKS